MAFDKISKYGLILLNLVIIVGAIIYRLFRLDYFFIIIILILAILFFLIILYLLNKYNTGLNNFTIRIKKDKKTKSIKTDYIFSAVYVLFLVICLFILFKHTSDQALISPWQKVPPYFFLFYFLASFCLSLAIFKKKPLAKLLLFLHYFLSFAVAVIVYKIGYGFDPFIHQATEKLISASGAVAPKPYYYLGQYALIVMIHKLAFIPIVYLDKLLVPVIAALTLPLALIPVLTKWLENKISALFTVLMLLILPFSFFIVTTPQNLAYLFLILALIYGLNCKNYLDLINIILLSLAAFAVHPLAGIPTILFALLLTVYCSDNEKYKNHLYRLIFLFMIIALPLAFLFISQGDNSLNATTEQTNTALAWPRLIFPNQENAILNTAYLFIFNFKIIYFLLILAGLRIMLKHKQECRILFLYLFSGLACLASYLLCARLSFGFLIAYERGDYSGRILTIAFLFFLPLAILALYGFFLKLSGQNKIIKLIFIVFFSSLLTISLYGSYPRFDNYHNSHGYSVSQNDITAVNWIAADAQSDYIVLANQQVSAAALREFGFKKYYQAKTGNNEQIFYYPIPTGGSLYQHYLDMVYAAPKRETVKAALALTGAETGYFVLNKYWWAFPKILAEAKLEADSWVEIGGGEIVIFKYAFNDVGADI